MPLARRAGPGACETASGDGARAAPRRVEPDHARRAARGSAGAEQRGRALGLALVGDSSAAAGPRPSPPGSSRCELPPSVRRDSRPGAYTATRGQGREEGGRLGGAAARVLPRDAAHPALRGEGRGALPRRRAARLPPRRDRPGGRRGRRLPRARGGRRDRLDAPRARAHARQGDAPERADGRALREARGHARTATAARCTSTTSSAGTSARTRSSAAGCRRSSAPRSPSRCATSRASRSRSSATARRTSARSTSR